MKGRGLLIAAAALQLIGGGLALLTAVSMLLMPVLHPQAGGALRAIGLVELVGGVTTIGVSVCLLQRQRWAWIVSLACASLVGVLLLAMPLSGLAMGAGHAGFGIGVGELIILAILGSPVYVDIGLLIGARHAVARAPMPSPVVIPPDA